MRNRDPYWTTARFNSKCSHCEKPVTKGDEIFYYPNNKQVMGKSCGCADDAGRDFASHVFDEEMYNSY